MMKILNLILAAFLLIFFFACGGESEEHKILHQASDIHLEALKIKKEMTADLEQLRQLNNGIQIQGRALNPDEINFAKGVNAIEQRLSYWDKNHMEVPGFEHEGHDHSGHNHSHDHGAKIEMPASDILIIQKEFKDSILAIKVDVNALLANSPK